MIFYFEVLFWLLLLLLCLCILRTFLFCFMILFDIVVCFAHDRHTFVWAFQDGTRLPKVLVGGLNFTFPLNDLPPPYYHSLVPETSLHCCMSHYAPCFVQFLLPPISPTAHPHLPCLPALIHFALVCAFPITSISSLLFLVPHTLPSSIWPST